MKKRVRIFNIEVDAVTREELLGTFTSGFLVTPNVDHLVLLQKDAEFVRAYRSADFVTVDSQIVYWALRFLGRRVPEKISGSDFLPAYCEYHRHDHNLRMFLLGGRPGVAASAAERINSRLGYQMVVAAHSPTMEFGSDPEENKRVVAMIQECGANVLVVGLGAPKQEKWIARHRHELSGVHTFMAMGATLDFEAGTASRAPSWMSNRGVEWLYRLFQEPGRMWRRYLGRDLRFFDLLLRDRFGIYRAPF